MQLIVGSRKRGVVTIVRDIATTIFTVVIVLTPDTAILLATIAAAVSTATFVIPSPTPAPASLTNAFPTPTSAPAAVVVSISIPACAPAAGTMTMMSLTVAVAATATVAVTMFVLIIPALSAAGTPASVATTAMASTLISCKLPVDPQIPGPS